MAFWLWLEGHLAFDKWRDYWASAEPGDWDIIPAGVVGLKVFEFERHTIPDLVPNFFYYAQMVWSTYRDGFLMYGGGRMDQPIIHNTIISCGNNVFAAWEKSKRKK